MLLTSKICLPIIVLHIFTFFGNFINDLLHFFFSNKRKSCACSRFEEIFDNKFPIFDLIIKKLNQILTIYVLEFVW